MCIFFKVNWLLSLEKTHCPRRNNVNDKYFMFIMVECNSQYDNYWYNLDTIRLILMYKKQKISYEWCDWGGQSYHGNWFDFIFLP